MSFIVYTSLTGEFDAPRIDIPNFTPSTDIFSDNRRASRLYKCLSHMVCPGHQWSIYVDANIFLKTDPMRLVKIVDQSGCDVGVFRHPKRFTIQEEAMEVVDTKKDDRDIVEKQIGRYMDAEPMVSYLVLAMCGIIVRRNCENVRRMNERWWAEICCGSCRDQISFPVAFDSRVHYFARQANIWNNSFFRRVKHVKKQTD